MNIDNLTKKLQENGIEAESLTIQKNGIECTGFRIITENENVCPVVYYSEGETLEAFLEKCHVAMNAKPEFKIENLTDSNFVKHHIILCAQKKSNENIVKKDYLNLEIYLRVIIKESPDGLSSFKVTNSFMSNIDLAEEELWNVAKDNTINLMSIQNIEELLGVSEEQQMGLPLFIATTTYKSYGASALALPEFFRDFCQKFEEDNCIILPASTEEVIIIPGSFANSDPIELAAMVDSINRSDVDPILRLDPVVYQYTLDDNDVTILASYEEVNE